METRVWWTKRPEWPWNDKQASIQKSIMEQEARILDLNVHFMIQKSLRREFQTFDIHMFVHRNIIPNYSQQDATFLEFIYIYRHSTCFRRFLYPSSGAHNCTYGFRYCQSILLPASWSCMYSCVLLMIGWGTAWNM